jgi:hypothetical protein
LHPFSLTPHSLRHRALFEHTGWPSKKVVNLTDEFESIYQRRRESFVRQQNIRLKTVA